MRSALLVLVGVHALLGCGAASRREPAADAGPAHVLSAAQHGSLGETHAPPPSPEEAPLPSPEEAPLRAPVEKERAALRLPGSERARDSAPDAPKERAPIPLSDKGRTPVHSAGKERAPVRPADKGRAARSLEADCKALGPEVQKASRMIEVLRQSDLSTPPDVLRRIADRLELWARTAAVPASDPKLAQAATELRESFARTGAAVRKFRASLVAPDRKKAGASRAGLERDLDQDAKVVRSIVGHCKSNPYDPIKGKAHIPPQVVRRVVQENFGAMRACYEKGLRQNPKLQGRIPVHLAVDGEGKVTYAGDADHPPADAPLLIALPSPGASAPSSTAPPLRDPKVVGCVLDVFRGLRFPSPTDRKSVATVVYPVVFGVDDNRSSATSAR
ncbi:AgmX/PglI C-terminal domain-containing protein [Sorangium sp. So ce590]|uniref:AgmX/PglI C-terminal domain-containing protein n=1 Tax=Sorangium sp. So ce590 TaxID=3133317 RepID=UPI003F5E26D9